MKLWQIHKFNGKNDYNLKFIFFTRLERISLFRIELSSLVTLGKHWLQLVFLLFLFRTIKKIEPLKNEETKNKAILKFWWSEFEKHILTKSIFCNHCLHYIEQYLLCLWVKTKGFQFFSLLLRISDFTSWS